MKKQAGQIVFITLLVLTVAITLVLAFIGRTTINTAITSQREDSARAFNAAEAGIESALKSGVNSVEILSSGAQFSVMVTNIGGAVGMYEFSKQTTTSKTETLWLVEHNTDGSIDESTSFRTNLVNLCWSQEATAPALSVFVIYKRSGTYYVARGAYDNDASRRGINNFSSPTSAGTGCGRSNMYVKSINFSTDFGINVATDTLLMLRIHPLYASTTIAFDPAAGILPLQAKRIESIGAADSGTTRKIVVYQQYKAPASIFDSVLYSQSSLSN
ncbi:MAG: pilus assembly PilX N-terminal domain-containing protein [Patescibacteria group bacterium]